ncbi:MAG TPA: hypothetical protein VHX14_05635 [Thermoanaerobaculia bacterium]|jgi:outer membrane biosynthesis protein TonB|nr:hypothetical protein [Thermoanaerobaculia bacterium]
MKIVRVVAVLAAVALSVVLFPNLQALPYFGLVLPPAPPTPPTPPAPPAVPAMSSIDVVPEPPEPPEPPTPPEPVEMASAVSIDLDAPEAPEERPRLLRPGKTAMTTRNTSSPSAT